MLRGTAIPSILVPLMLGACGKPDPPVETARARHLAELREIARQCHLPASTLELVGEDRVSFRFSTDVQYRNADCALARLEKTGLRLGFVGNEAFEPGNSR